MFLAGKVFVIYVISSSNLHKLQKERKRLTSLLRSNWQYVCAIVVTFHNDKCYLSFAIIHGFIESYQT